MENIRTLRTIANWQNVMLFAVVLLPVAGWGKTAKTLADFETPLEEPDRIYVVEQGVFRPHDPPTFHHIVEEAPGLFRMTLHYSQKAWDEDRDKGDSGRQRAEVRGLGPRQLPGETFEYASTWRTDPDFHAASRFCHVFQVKAVDGDRGAPLVTESLDHDGLGTLRLWSGKNPTYEVAREFNWSPATWMTMVMRVKISDTDGELTGSANGGPFTGKTHVPVYRPDATQYRPKWGLYRAVAKGLPLHDDYVEHKEVKADKQ